MNATSIENLISQADAQREHLHETAAELKEKLETVRERLNVAKNAREHLPAAFVVLSLVGMIAVTGSQEYSPANSSAEVTWSVYLLCCTSECLYLSSK